MTKTTLLLTLVLFLTPYKIFAIDFTGNAVEDFPVETCTSDPGGNNIALPSSFPSGAISGFDLKQICLLYDGITDTLFVGVVTFDHVTIGTPIPFGDADGDGDPSVTGSALLSEGGVDNADLSDVEHFSFILDFDDDLATTPEVIAGVSAERDALNGFRVNEVAEPHLGIDFSFLSVYYGSSIAASSSSALFASPTASQPHLEFNIQGFSSLPGFSTLDTDDPDEAISIVFKAGSLGDTVIGDEDLRTSLPISLFFDEDGDELPIITDWDQDNDGVPDITEQDLEGFDTDGDGELSASEVSSSGLDSDGDGDLDSSDDGITYTNTDGDSSFDYLDIDTDDDTILDIDETNTSLFDTDGSRSISPDELLLIDVDGNYPGG